MKFGKKMQKHPYYWKLWLNTKEILCGHRIYSSDKNALRCMIPFVASHCAKYHEPYIVERFRIEDVDGHVLFDCFPEYERRHKIEE